MPRRKKRTGPPGELAGVRYVIGFESADLAAARQRDNFTTIDDANIHWVKRNGETIATNVTIKRSRTVVNDDRRKLKTARKTQDQDSLRELMAQYDSQRERWLASGRPESEFNAWFTGQVNKIPRKPSGLTGGQPKRRAGLAR